jgi:phytoene synthase
VSVAPAPTKRPGTENFPVASVLLAPALRAPVLRFYGFVRTADDVADSPDLAAAEKLRRLDALEAALVGADPGVPGAEALAWVDRRHGAGVAEARQLLDAFRQDAVKRRYADWDELLAYCRRSADPVGRFLLRLHGEPAAAQEPADALCTALQILNHLQDLGPDRAQLDRVYLPVPWMERVGGEERFFAPDAAATRRPVLDAALDQVDQLLATAETLPSRLSSPRLARQAAATLTCGRMLSRRLRREDPLMQRVSLRPADVARAVGSALLRGRHSRRDIAVARSIVLRSSSSFRLGMASLAAERRRGIHAVYAFCRVVDDAADGEAPSSERRRFIELWREELDRLDSAPRTPVGRELAWAARRFDLAHAELRLLLDGMAGDAADRVRLADEAALDGYCRAVAGTVGLLSVRIFGARGAEAFALRLGRALQLVNILRDVEEDAARERVYVPCSRLAAVGIADGAAQEIVRDGRFAQAWTALAREAEAAFAAAEAALAGLDRRALRPALIMHASYRPLLAKLQRQGWRWGGPRVRLGRIERLRLAGLALWGAA